jgi:hypothetical protein
LIESIRLRVISCVIIIVFWRAITVRFNSIEVSIDAEFISRVFFFHQLLLSNLISNVLANFFERHSATQL